VEVAMATLSTTDICPQCGETFYYCEDCGGILEACSKGCCYGPEGPTYLADCVCDYSIQPK